MGLLTAFACGLALSALAGAQAPGTSQPEYRVELLVLRHLNNEGRSFEAPKPPLVEAAGETEGPDASRDSDRSVRWRGLPWAEFQLKNEFARLRRSRDFRPLLHLGWTQAALDSDAAGWVSVRGGADDGSRIDGRARLTVNRYLNLRLELDAAIPEKGEFRLAQSRRMKSGELHYFDHPEFGVLVEIIPEPKNPEPVENPDPEQEKAAGQ